MVKVKAKAKNRVLAYFKALQEVETLIEEVCIECNQDNPAKCLECGLSKAKGVCRRALK